MSKSMSPAGRAWIAPALLLALAVVPVAAGVARLVWLGAGEIRPDSARFAAAPAPLVLHILSIFAFSLLGPFQFAAGGRGRRPAWHRAAGRAMALAGLVAAGTGLWMTQVYPPGVNDGDLLHGLRLVFGSAMAASLLLGLDAVRRRDFARHRDWMMRAYAIGMGAGTQVIVYIPWLLLVGPVDERSRALLMGAGWAINLVVAEGIIRQRRGRATTPASGVNLASGA